MKKNTFKSYKEAIIKQYAIAQNEDVSGILSSPTPAQLRDFCGLLCVKGLTLADEQLMKGFFETKPDESLKRSIEQCNIDKFKPLISFLKGDKDTENQTRVGLSAIIVNFEPRPFAKFLGNASNTAEKESNSNGNLMIKETNPDFAVKDDLRKGLYRRWLYLILGIVGVFSVGYVVKDVVLPKKQCMQWQNDHYELVDCQNETNSLYTSSPILPTDDKAMELKKIVVSDTTTFFEGGKASIWYCKVDGVPEFFDGPGFHPITGKGLRPVTDYIIEKYIKK
jgi:hypothetical protein